jgi:RNA polymerase sigma-70 factor (ECF subfamily)
MSTDASPQPSGTQPSPEQRFLEYVRTGDTSTIQALLGEFSDRSFNQARRIVGRRDGTEDAVQDAYVRLVRSAHKYDGSVTFSAWLARLVNLAALDHRNRRQLRHAHLSDLSDQGVPAMPTQDPDSADTPEVEALRTALDSLPDRYREPLTLYYFGGLNQRETAQALGAPADRIEKRISRGLERLRGMLSRAGFAVTGAGLLALLSGVPAYAASPAFKASVIASERFLVAGRQIGSRVLAAKSQGAAWIGIKVAVISVAALSTVLMLQPHPKADPVRHAPGLTSLSAHSGTAWTIPGTIEAEHFDAGGPGVGYHDVDGTYALDAYPERSVVDRAQSVDISRKDGGSVVDFTYGGEWLAYTVNVVAAGSYLLEARVSAIDSGGAFHIAFDGVDKTGPITMPPYAGSFDSALLRLGNDDILTWQTLTRTVSLRAGPQVMHIVFDKNGVNDFEVANLNYIRLTAVNAP